MHRFEALKLIRSWRPAVALAATALFLLLMLLGFYTYARTETGGRAEFRYTFENESYFNGLTFALYAFHFGVLMVVPVFAACEGGAQLAGETAARTVQLLLARPISRSRIFLAKLAVSALYLSLLVGLLLAAAMLVGLGTVGWGDLDLYPGVLQMAERHQHLPQPAALRAFLLAWPTAVVAMSAPLALGFLLAAWSRNPVNAVAAAIAVYVVLYVTSEITCSACCGPGCSRPIWATGAACSASRPTGRQ